MELDPMAVAGGFNLPYGIEWFGYATGNPTRWTDPLGLKINTTVGMGGPVVWGSPIKGKDGFANFDDEWTPAGCRQSGGSWGFDVDLKATTHEYYRRGKCNQPSLEEPGKTVCQHERHHAEILKAALLRADATIRTEGFAERCECEAALARFAADMSAFNAAVDAESRRLDHL